VFDRQTDGGGWTDRILIAKPRLHSMQCGLNVVKTGCGLGHGAYFSNFGTP